MTAYKAVLFDLDGTLLDTLADLSNSMNSVLERYGWPTHGPERYKYLIGDGVENLVRQALPESRRDETTLAACIKMMREEYGRRWAETTRPYPGVPELLDGLAARNMLMAILSNKMDDFAQLTVARLLPGWSFQVVQGARPGVPKKPDPAAALNIAAALELSPAEFLYLGDTGTDMATAVAAGMVPVGVLWGFRPAEELTASGARFLLQQPADLLKLL